MSSRSPSTDRIRPLFFSALLVIGMLALAFNTITSINSKIHDTNTHYVLASITAKLATIETDPPTTRAELLSLLTSLPIDWQTCEAQEDGILDGWGNPILTNYDKPSRTWTFRSGGYDFEDGTGDDIEYSVQISRPS